MIMIESIGRLRREQVALLDEVLHARQLRVVAPGEPHDRYVVLMLVSC